MLVPDADRNGPSVTEFALRRPAVNARSNCHDCSSVASAMEIGMWNVSPTFTVAEPAVIVGAACPRPAQSVTISITRIDERRAIIRTSPIGGAEWGNVSGLSSVGNVYTRRAAHRRRAYFPAKKETIVTGRDRSDDDSSFRDC